MEPTKMRSGKELKSIRDESEFTDADILVAAKVSMSTLHKIYRDEPTVRPKLRRRVEEAISNLLRDPREAG